MKSCNLFCYTIYKGRERKPIMTLKLKHIIGFGAIVAGAIATLDGSMMPIMRYLLIYFSLLVITGVVLHGIYIEMEDTPTLDKVKDEQ